MKIYRKILWTWAIAIVATAPFAAMADQELETMVVTAQKTEEDIQEIPGAISAFDKIFLEDATIESVEDMTSLVPNFFALDMGDSCRYIPSIRGLNANIQTFFTDVATYVDGVPYLDSMGNNISLLDVNRVEILRGPQGTLYGKNAYAGVINIITPQPDNDVQGRIQLGYGSDAKKEILLNMSGPVVSDKLYMGILGSFSQQDGFIENTWLNKPDNDHENFYGRSYIRFIPFQPLEISLISSFLKRNDGATSIAPVSAANPRQTQSGEKGYNKPESLSHALKIQYKFNEFNMSNIFSYKKQKENMYVDYDFSPRPVLDYKVEYPYENYSWEMKLERRTNQFQWIVGGTLYKDEKTPYFLMNSRPVQDNVIESDCLGIFAHGTYRLTPELSLTGGVRYDHDTVDLDDRLAADKQSRTYHEISPKLSAAYDFSKKLMAYFTVSKGYKSGGYFMFAPTELKAYGKESMWNYETGIKGMYLGNRLLLNIAFFYMDIKNMQVMNNIDPVRGYISNAASVASKGVEAEARLKITKQLSLSASLGYNKATFEDYADAMGRYNGNFTPYAPEFTYYVGATYRNPTGWFAKLSAYGQDSFYTDKSNNFQNGGYTLFDGKIGYEGQNMEIYLYGKNLADKRHDVYGFSNGGYIVVSKPREIGLQVAWRF